MHKLELAHRQPEPAVSRSRAGVAATTAYYGVLVEGRTVLKWANDQGYQGLVMVRGGAACGRVALCTPVPSLTGLIESLLRCALSCVSSLTCQMGSLVQWAGWEELGGRMCCSGRRLLLIILCATTVCGSKGCQLKGLGTIALEAG